MVHGASMNDTNGVPTLAQDDLINYDPQNGRDAYGPILPPLPFDDEFSNFTQAGLDPSQRHRDQAETQRPSMPGPQNQIEPGISYKVLAHNHHLRRATGSRWIGRGLAHQQNNRAGLQSRTDINPTRGLDTGLTDRVREMERRQSSAIAMLSQRVEELSKKMDTLSDNLERLRIVEDESHNTVVVMHGMCEEIELLRVAVNNSQGKN